MRHNKAQNISRGDWWEIMEHPLVKKLFNVRNFERWDDFANRVYGARFVIEDEIGQPIEIFTLVGRIGKGEVLTLERVNGEFKRHKYH